MSLRMITAVLDADLEPTEKLIMVVIADAANDEGVAWPGIQRLKKVSGLSESSVRRHLKELSDPDRPGGAVIIIKSQFRISGSQTSNRYQIIKQALADPCPPVTVTPPAPCPPVTVTPPHPIPPVTVTPPAPCPPVTVTPPPVTVTPHEPVIEPVIKSKPITSSPLPPPPAEEGEEVGSVEKRLPSRFAIKLGEQVTGRLLNGLQVEFMQRLCSLYPRSRIEEAFVAAQAAGATSLNWVKKWLDNPNNGRDAPDAIKPIQEQEWYKRRMNGGNHESGTAGNGDGGAAAILSEVV